jgi:membrane-associated HD superfamily phosphohydrolase
VINLARIGFRSALFGFNKDDVNLYLMKLQQEYALKEQEINKSLADLEKEKAVLEEKLKTTTGELDRVNAEFAYLKGKEQEIEQISESIGTMYMVAMQNAGEIVSEAESISREINEISALRLEAATKAEEQLKAIKENIKTSAEQFAENINSMSLSLEGPKNRLAAQLEAGAQKTALPEITTEFKNE